MNNEPHYPWDNSSEKPSEDVNSQANQAGAGDAGTNPNYQQNGSQTINGADNQVNPQGTQGSQIPTYNEHGYSANTSGQTSSQQPVNGQPGTWNGAPQYPAGGNVPPYGYGGQPGGWYNIPPQKPKKKMKTGTKAFLIIISVIACVSVVFFAVFSFVKIKQIGNGGTTPSINGFNESSAEEYNGNPFTFDSGSSGNESSAYEQPNIEVSPYTEGIKVSKKSSGTELTAEQIYKKVISSIVTVTAEIPETSNSSSATSVGTGMFLTSNGYIITNSHVIGNTKTSKLTITTSDGTDHEAIAVGYDTETDIALLKIDGEGYTPIEIGDSTELSIGESVIVIGSSGGSAYEGSLTKGVISGLNRQVGYYSNNGMTYIQTDAAINPGNSGGPLLNMYGQVIGMSSSKIVSSYYEGMGFAISLSNAQDVINQLLAQGYVSGRTRLGISASDSMDTYNGGYNGVAIVSINDESSFTGTDAQVGDIITAIDDTTVTDITDLRNALLLYSPGDTVTVTLSRNGQELKVTVKLLSNDGQTQK
jgi:serine protease Do